MNNVKQTSQAIKNSWKQRVHDAEDKALEVQKLTEELATAISDEKGALYLEQTNNLIAQNLTPKECGLRPLSKSENTFYEKMSTRITNPTQALTAPADTIMPVTIINKVFEDLKKEHKLLSFVDIAPAGLKKWIVSEAENTATWTDLTTALVENITANIKEIDLETLKLTAFFTIPKGIVDLGFEWLDKYVRTIISEAIYKGLEKGIINGNGYKEPIGMIKDLDNSANHIYADKTAVILTDFGTTSYCAAVAKLTKNGTRPINRLGLIVNPLDYLTKVLPAMSFRTPTGEYVNTLPYPTEIIECAEVPNGKAILGLGAKYLIGASALELKKYAETLAVDDKDLYVGKVYSNGRPFDNDSYILLDIENVKPANEVVPKTTK